MSSIRVLVADDSALMRQTLKRIVCAEPGLELAGTARDGEDAVAKARELRPDVITMDINMPKLDGVTAMQMILAEKICPVVMVSSLTQRGAMTTFECLELGAFDFVAKPDGTVSANLGAVAADLVAKLRAAANSGVMQRLHKNRARRLASRERVETPVERWTPDGPVAVAIGISTGGPATLGEVLPLLPPDLPASVFLVQHMPAAFLGTFARRLNENCSMKVVEARAGMSVEPGTCYVAPGGLHLCPYRKARGEVVLRTPSQPQTLFVPSVSVMMQAVLEAYGRRTVGVLMTGIGDDGANQMVAIRQAGGSTIAESEETAVVFGMPREAIERGGADVVVPHYEVARQIVQAVGKVGGEKMIELRECIDKLTSADEADRMYAAEDIGYANQAAGVDPLLARLPEESSRAVREAIFGALRQIEHDSVIEGVLQLLDSNDSFLRNQAVEILRERGARAIPFLDQAFRAEDCDRRKFVIDILGRLGDAGTSGIYARALKDPDLNVVITAVESVGNARQAKFRETVAELISPGAHPMLTCASLEALAQIGDAASMDMVRARLGPVGELPGYLQPAYLKLLGAMGRQEDVSAVAEMIGRDGLEPSVLNALTALRNRHSNLKLPDSLSQPLRDVVSSKTSPHLAYQAVRLLSGLLHEPAVFDFVERCLEDSEKSIRIGAGQSMREAGNEAADAALRRRMGAETDEEVLQAWGGKSTE